MSNLIFIDGPYYHSGEYEKGVEASTKKIEKDPSSTEGYLERSLCLRKLHKYDAALDDLFKILEVDRENCMYYFMIAEIYSDLNNYEEAIKYNTQAINIKPNYYLAYNNRATAYNHLRLYNNAIDDLNRAIEIIPDYVIAYQNRAFTFLQIDEFIPAILDYITYIYLCKIDKYNRYNILVNHKLVSLLTSFAPHNVNILREHLDIESFVFLFNYFEESYIKTKDFTLLLEYFEVKELLSGIQLLKYKSIIYYFLGGSISSRIIFDKLKNSDFNLLTSIELFYFAKSSLEVQINQETIINDCINNLKPINDIDKYYLAQLYNLQNNKTEAIRLFEQTETFIYSKIMLCYLTENKKLKEKLVTEIKSFDFPHLANFIDISSTDLTQFTDYFYYTECLEAINSLNELFDLNINLVFSLFWEEYKLKNDTKEYIETEILRIKTLKLIEVIKKYFSESVTKFKPNDVNEYISKLYQNFKNDTITFQKTLLIDEIKKKNESVEDFLGVIIYEWNPKEPHLYLYLIEYYYLTNAIDVNQVFTLFIYLIKITEKNHNDEINEKVEQLFVNLLLVGIPGLLKVMFKDGFKLFRILTKNYDEYNLYETSNYQIFKDEFWKYIAFEKERLSDDIFKRKYQIFQWFDNYCFKNI